MTAISTRSLCEVLTQHAFTKKQMLRCQELILTQQNCHNHSFCFWLPIFQNVACVFFFAGGRAPDLAVLRANPAKEHAKIRQSRPFVIHFSAPHLADATFSCGVPIGFFWNYVFHSFLYFFLCGFSSRESMVLDEGNLFCAFLPVSDEDSGLVMFSL